MSIDQKINQAWFVGAAADSDNGNYHNFADECIDAGIWKYLGDDQADLDQIKLVQVGDKIVLKSTSNQTHRLPFNSYGAQSGFMRIKAYGTVTANDGGKTLKVDWEKKFDSSKKTWYGEGTYRPAIFLVKANRLATKNLFEFVFEDKPQNYELCEEYYKKIYDKKNQNTAAITDEHSVEGLAQILREKIKNSKENEKVLNIHLFGIQYGRMIRENNLPCKAIIVEAGLKESLVTELDKGINLSNYVQLQSEEEMDSVSDVISGGYDFADRATGGNNVILYGVPGAGKSWTIEQEYCNDETKIERLVFHPDYTYTDFVGQILPKVYENDKVKYEFTPGPFTKILEKAYKNPQGKYYLIIEEINRGNAPAIFGDVFQLLDRNPNGSSEYSITNAEIAQIVYKDKYHKVSIPSNLSIICTMNTSDQNVFTLDTAFQRRWEMRLINNEFHSNPKEEEFARTPILDTKVTWENFITAINKIILEKNLKLTSSEDKRLGTHFVKSTDLFFDSSVDDKGIMTADAKRQNSKFAEKVLKYLWDDAFKFTKEDVFDLETCKSFEDVARNFINNTGSARFNVLKRNVVDALFQVVKN